MFRKFLLVILIVVSSSSFSSQEDFEAGLAAFRKQDFNQAMFLWGKIAEEHPRAQNGIGVLYRDGLGQSADVEMAAYWFRRSSENGYAYGMYNLALLYLSDLETKRNKIEAFKWLYLATAINFDHQALVRMNLLGNKMTDKELNEAKEAAQNWFDNFFK